MKQDLQIFFSIYLSLLRDCVSQYTYIRRYIFVYKIIKVLLTLSCSPCGYTQLGLNLLYKPHGFIGELSQCSKQHIEVAFSSQFTWIHCILQESKILTMAIIRPCQGEEWYAYVRRNIIKEIYMHKLKRK